VDELQSQNAGRRWSDGLHQAVEAKEGVQIDARRKPSRTITIQNYFRLYQKRPARPARPRPRHAGSGIYKLDVNVIPTNRPVARKDYNDRIYKTRRGSTTP
jgi:preprotein translocase subunit SecA